MLKYPNKCISLSLYSGGIQEFSGVFRGIQARYSGYSGGIQGIQAAHFGVFSGELRRHLPSVHRSSD